MKKLSAIIIILIAISCKKTYKRDFWLNVSDNFNLSKTDSFLNDSRGIFKDSMIIENKGSIINNKVYFPIKDLLFLDGLNGKISRVNNDFYFYNSESNKENLLLQLNQDIGKIWYIPTNQFIQMKITYEGCFLYNEDTLWSFNIISSYDRIDNPSEEYQTLYLTRNEIIFLKLKGRFKGCYLIDYKNKNITRRTTHLNFPEPWEFPNLSASLFDLCFNLVNKLSV